jgi:hypothetical protein
VEEFHYLVRCAKKKGPDPALLIFHHYTRSSDSTPLISALLGLVLIEKLTKSSISALFSAYF